MLIIKGNWRLIEGVVEVKFKNFTLTLEIIQQNIKKYKKIPCQLHIFHSIYFVKCPHCMHSSAAIHLLIFIHTHTKSVSFNFQVRRDTLQSDDQIQQHTHTRTCSLASFLPLIMKNYVIFAWQFFFLLFSLSLASHGHACFGAHVL